MDKKIEDASELLAKHWGYESFRARQSDIVRNILEGRDVLAIMPTGAGKSICYQVPALMLPDMTLVVSPLISLMHDQVGRLKSLGIAAAYIDSTLSVAEAQSVLDEVRAGMHKILYVSPERLQSYHFKKAMRGVPVSLLAVDEAHCVLRWGAAFRPEYAMIPRFYSVLPSKPVIAAFTATASRAGRAQICELLSMREPETIVTGFDRPNLRFSVYPLSPQARVAAARDYAKRRKGESGIVYCVTKKEVEEVASELKRAGISAARYHSDCEAKEKDATLEGFLAGRIDVVVATSAFGMGIDKPDVRYVLSLGLRDNLEDYYQNAGRAGRDGKPADCILLYSAERDLSLWDFLHEKAFENADLAGDELAFQKKRVERELSIMLRYCESEGCLRTKILKYFGDTIASDECGNCGVCRGLSAKEAKAIVPHLSRPTKPNQRERNANHGRSKRRTGR